VEIAPKLETDVTKKYRKYKVTDFKEILKWYQKDHPKVCVLDAETTGLHIKKDKPFMWVFGWLTDKKKQDGTYKGRVFAFEHDESLLNSCIHLSKDMKFLFGHNVN